MYQVYGLLGMLVMTWAIAIWASFPRNKMACGNLGRAALQHGSSSFSA